jgi:arylsulfatase A-like enzyme
MPSLVGAGEQKGKSPNVVIFFADDLGYGDIGPFGSTGYDTPNLNGMAVEGKKFTSFYVAQAVCSASRTALLTGCFPNRVGILGALGPTSKTGINKDEMLIAEVAKQKGYATCAVGKWHLGHHVEFLPTRHGFDEYFGLPYSNDMWPHHPQTKSFPALPLIQNEGIIDSDVDGDDQKTLTRRYSEFATQFIDENYKSPFLLYFAFSMPHVPLYVSDEFSRRAPRGLFGDVIQEVDWAIGQVLAKVDQYGLKDNTLVIFTSDNGPWLAYGDHAGSAGPLREGKGTSWEGGVREPCIMRWPGRIKSGTTCDEVAATIDILPTVASIIGAELPKHKIDGKDISPLLFVDDAKSPHEAYFYFWGNSLEAVRSGDYKLVFPHAYRHCDMPGSGGIPGKYVQRNTGMALYNLKKDIGETTDIKDQHPEIVAKLEVYAEGIRKELGDGKILGSGLRSAGKLAE